MKMTVNELIEVLKESGDDKFRSTAQVRIVNDGGWVNEPGEWDAPVDAFNVKIDACSVDIHV